MSSDCWNAGRQKKETPQPVPTYRYSKLNTAPPNRNHPRRTGLFHQRCYTFFLRCGFPHQRLLNEGCFTKKNSTFFNFVGASGAGLEGVATIVDARSMRSEHRRLRIDHLCSITLPPPQNADLASVDLNRARSRLCQNIQRAIAPQIEQPMAERCVAFQEKMAKFGADGGRTPLRTWITVAHMPSSKQPC